VSTAATRHGGKSAAAFRTISEVSDDLDVPQHVLRFWETKFTQVRPLKRGGGRRYYRPDDIELLRRIRNLLYSDGYTIKGVQKLLREGGGRREQAPPHRLPRPPGPPSWARRRHAARLRPRGKPRARPRAIRPLGPPLERPLERSSPRPGAPSSRPCCASWSICATCCAPRPNSGEGAGPAFGRPRI
jgi:DNA-binding transcriptional MerR regulator